MATNPLLNEEIYLAKNPAVAKAVTDGKYPSGSEEFSQIGQFQERSGVIFEGTSGNDLVQASGQKSSVIGVKVESAEVGSRLINAKTGSLGVGEFDTLLGSPGRNVFYLGDNNKDNPVDFYLGKGDKDYGLIRNFDPTSEDAVYLAGKPEDYTFKTINGSVNISKGGDLIGVVEGVPKLIADGLFTEKGSLLFAPQNSYWASRTQPYFNEPAYLAANPDVKALIEAKTYTSGWDHFSKVGIDEGRQTFFNGKIGNDSFFYPLGNATVVSFPITKYDPVTKAIETATTGTGDRDHYHGSFGNDRFLLGNAGKDFYVGQGDKDYVLIGDFDRAKDKLIMAKDLSEYKLDVYDDNFQGVVYKEFQISTKDGDVIARIEDGETLKLKQIASEIPGTTTFVSSEYKGVIDAPSIEPTKAPLAAIFGTTDENTIDVTGAKQNVFAGAGNDTIDATESKGGNRIYAGTGDDTIIVGANDVIKGQDGNDRFFVQTGGGNFLTGGAGADQFWIANAEIPKSANTITDFTIGQDVLGVAGVGASFGTLTLTQQDNNTLISFNKNDLAILTGIQSSSLSASNFAFV
jgi:Ca2+-binding RTX toxin-like protein